MISYADFSRLRLAHFVRDPGEVADLDDWEFMEDLWVGEAMGFTEWLRLAEEPDVLRSLSLDMPTLSDSVAGRVLDALDLPVHYGMSLSEVVHRLGEPTDVLRFGRDRTTYEFRVGERDVYDLSCTIHHRDGLIYLVVMAPTPRREPAAEGDGSAGDEERC
ncbi:MAG: hypothetical protein JWM27_4415 [Gemmatimonadetes bacterium]|nr:hypothetical protein [Gemmatimonadota bacterium]